MKLFQLIKEMSRIVEVEITNEKWNEAVLKIKKQAYLRVRLSPRVRKNVQSFINKGINYNCKSIKYVNCSCYCYCIFIVILMLHCM